jgi:uncharacterized protein (TIGR00255 family)
MTGFGRSEGQIGTSFFTVEIKSVNHRYLDTRFRLPVALGLYEIPLAERLRGGFERGSFEINVRQKLISAGATVPSGTRFVVDEMAARSLFDGCEWLGKKFGIESVPTLELFALANRVFLPVEEVQDTEGLLEAVKQIFDKALADLKKMRESEGRHLKLILQEGVKRLLEIVKELEVLAPEQPKKIQERLKTRIAQWNLATSVDAQRIELEVALYAERSDITEELDRLRTHANEFLALLDRPKGVGRKLDFLTQELHREINTVSSKASLVELTQAAVEAKTLIEKLREQVQNVE